MNIGIMQLSNINISTKPGVKNHSTVDSNQSNSGQEKFGDVFNKAVAASQKNESSKTYENKADSIDIDSLEAMLTSQSMEEVLELIGIPQDQGLLMINAGENGEVVAMDELLDLENLLSVLGIEQEQLVDSLQQLTGVQLEGAKNLWQIVDGILGQDAQVVQQLMAAVQGEHKVTPKQAEQLVQFLKLTQVTGKNSDLSSGQEATLEQLNNMLKSIAKDSSSQISQIQSIKLVVQEIAKITESVETTEKTETTQTSAATTNTLNTTKTISITLPTEKGAQSEALAKEIQNLLNRSQISNTPGTVKLLLKLYPENLGSIRIEIMQQDGVLSARLLTTTAIGKELLDSQLHQLKSAFANANIQMDRIDIAQSLQETDRNKDQNQFNQQFKRNSEKDEQRQDEQEEDTEKLSFSDYLINEEV